MLFPCDDCGELVTASALTHVDGEMLCADCAAYEQALLIARVGA
jgi:formylmethanofuran dehydrogenase subunit E